MKNVIFGIIAAFIIFSISSCSNPPGSSVGGSSLSSPGTVIGWIGGGNYGWQTGSGASSGSSEAYFNGPGGVYVDSSGNIYVVDYYNNRICKWNSSGVVQGWIGGGNSGWQTGSGASSGNGEAYFNNISGVYAFGSVIYVADGNNNRICKWNSSGVVQGWIGGGNSGWQTGSGASSGNGEAYFNGPVGVYIDLYGNINVAEYNNNRISKWH